MAHTRGHWVPGDTAVPGRAAVVAGLETHSRSLAVVSTPEGPAAATSGQVVLGDGDVPPGALPLLAYVPALPPDALGDPGFRATYGVRVAHVAGAMANGISSQTLVIEMARAGMMGFFGAAGLSTDRIRTAIDRISAEVGALPWGSNLIHSPAEPWQEQETVDLYLDRGVTVVSASAYMALTPMVVQYRATGMRRRSDGTAVPRNRLLAKVSRPEVAERFLRPPPDEMLRGLVAAGKLTEEEARLAATLPMADDLTAEADSGGHTDNRPLPVLLPLLIALRDRLGAPVRVGAAGGIGCPEAAAAALSMGAAYVLTGTINQACVESGTSEMARALLAEAGMADVAMAPASDMFEAGVELQVLRRGTLFAQRAAALYRLYRDYPSLEAIPAAEAKRIEETVLRASFDTIWQRCEAFFTARDPVQLQRAQTDPKHRMALVFRWYLGKSSRWAIAGEASRRTDAQIWCGPAIGAFNDWTRDSFLARPEERRVAVVGANLMAGAALQLRLGALQQQGVDVGPLRWRPRRLHPVALPPPNRETHAAV